MIKVSETEKIILSSKQAKRTSMPSSMAPATRLVRYPGQKVSISQKVVAKSCGRINFDAGRLCTSTYLPKVNGAAIRTCRSEKPTTDLDTPALAEKNLEPAERKFLLRGYSHVGTASKLSPLSSRFNAI